MVSETDKVIISNDFETHHAGGSEAAPVFKELERASHVVVEALARERQEERMRVTLNKGTLSEFCRTRCLRIPLEIQLLLEPAIIRDSTETRVCLAGATAGEEMYANAGAIE